MAKIVKIKQKQYINIPCICTKKLQKRTKDNKLYQILYCLDVTLTLTVRHTDIDIL